VVGFSPESAADPANVGICELHASPVLTSGRSRHGLRRWDRRTRRCRPAPRQTFPVDASADDANAAAADTLIDLSDPIPSRDRRRSRAPVHNSWTHAFLRRARRRTGGEHTPNVPGLNGKW
jgi:hypothetical protein